MEDKLEALKQQVQADFELTWTMMNDQGRRLDARIDEVKGSLEEVKLALERVTFSVDKMGAEIQEGNRQVVGRMRLLEERFRAVIEAVQNEMKDKASRHELLELARRLEALEKRPPAA